MEYHLRRSPNSLPIVAKCPTKSVILTKNYVILEESLPIAAIFGFGREQQLQRV